MKIKNGRKGQALTLLLVFAAVGGIVTMAAVILALVHYQLASKFAQADNAYVLAESGAENALLRLLRNPSYSGETMSLDGGTIQVEVSGISPKTIISEGHSGTLKRTVKVDVALGNTLSILNWREVP